MKYGYGNGARSLPNAKSSDGTGERKAPMKGGVGMGSMMDGNKPDAFRGDSNKVAYVHDRTTWQDKK